VSSNSSFSIFSLVLLAFCLSFFTPVEVIAGKSGRPSLIRSDSYNLESSLQRAAAKFFPKKAKGHLYSVLLKDRTEMYTDGVEFETYDVSFMSSGRIGSFTRLKLVTGGDCRVDIAFLMRGNVIVDAFVMRIAVVDGVPITKFRDLLYQLKGKAPVDYPEGFGKFCKSLITISRQCAVPKDQPIMDKAFVEAFLAALPKPVTSVPDFSVMTHEGKTVTQNNFKGKPFLLFNGSVTYDSALSMYELLQVFQVQSQGKVPIIFNWEDMASVFDRESPGIAPMNGTHIIDYSGELKSSFLIPTMLQIYP